MKKSKFLKPFSFTSLAFLMGIAGTIAFAPLGASPSVASASEMVDQINTKADGENIKYAPSALGLDPENDPVIYTTESGLEIKYGGESVSDQLASGQPLAGYPYFTMGTYNGYAVNWVIIGRNINDDVFLEQITHHLFSSWKTNNSKHSGTYENKGYYFFKDHYEATTPAGSAINGVVPSKSYVADVTKVTKTVVGNAEVPSGCVLAYSECVLGTSQFHSTNQNTNYEVSLLKTAMNNRFENLALTTQQKNEIIVKQDLVNNYSKKDNVFETTYSSQQPFWPLGYNHSSAPKNENFLIDTYLTSNALRKAYSIGTTSFANYWTRGPTSSCHDICLVEPSGAISATLNGGNIDTNSTLGVRPACVVKLH